MAGGAGSVAWVALLSPPQCRTRTGELDLKAVVIFVVKARHVGSPELTIAWVGRAKGLEGLVEGSVEWEFRPSNAESSEYPGKCNCHRRSPE
jgi:hypothetical protein